ncbi:MAG: tRNA 4-thiouridine(8) synthase ThiI, partial [Thermodesulfobacteriota bacterium]
LCSGGLDSILSALVLRDQGIEVAWITFETPFFSSQKARAASNRTGVPLMVREITETYLGMLRNPRAGYGKNMNPCLDCHSLMFRLAGEIMQEQGFDFLFSGEVLGQRPMSQNRPALSYVLKHSGFGPHILRPLSAKLLPKTAAEENGLVDRERLLAFSGRSRKPQMALAEKFGIKEYPTPAGGCLLTDVGFSRRLSDLFGHEEGGPSTVREIELLKHGRHFRLSPLAKAAVGRNEAENESICALYDAGADVLFWAENVPGPRVLVPRGAGLEEAELVKAAGLAACYSKAEQGSRVAVRACSARGERTLSLEVPDRAHYKANIL